ncbi:MAG: hypothetical protein DI589_25470 [Shinella sp.]|nr:MAG: hypothetical protein DI589_25470 [Shinella sp.]
MKGPPNLPLFRRAELDALQERREALLKRLQGLRPHSHRRVRLQDRLQAVTVEILALETRSERRP